MKPSFEVSPDVRRLTTFLENRDSATYKQMNLETGRILNGRDRYVLSSAIRVLQRERGAVFVSERGVGVKRATNGQVAALGTDHVIDKTKRIVSRAKKLHPLVNTQALTPDQRDAFWIGKAVTQALDITVGRKMRSRIAEEIKDQGEEIDMKDVIAMFKRSPPKR